MVDYRLYLIGASGSIAAAHEIACDDHNSAIARAPRDLRRQSIRGMARSQQGLRLCRQVAGNRLDEPIVSGMSGATVRR
jgi:hypothetical protein